MSEERLVAGFPWDVLGLAPTPDEKAIRTAYAALVRQYRPDSHPLEFSRVREAYEQAMQQARRLRALQEAQEQAEAPMEVEAPAGAPDTAAQEPTATAPVPEAPPMPAQVPWQKPAAAREPLPPATPPVPVELPAPATAPPEVPSPAADAGPAWHPHEAVQALSDRHNTQGEIAAAALLREHLARSARETIDARLDYEWLLLRSLLASEAPPLALVFEGNRSFGWSERLDDVAHAFGDRAARRLALLAEMADRWLYASRYSPNGWDRRLFSPPDRRLPWFAAAGLVTASLGTAAHWVQSCEQLELPALRGRLNVRALRRMQGPLVLAPDLGLALMAVLLCFDVLVDLGLVPEQPWFSTGVMAAALAGTLLCCLGLRWLALRPAARMPRAAWGWLREHVYLSLFALGCLAVGGVVAVGSSSSPTLQAYGTVALAVSGACLLALLVRLVWYAAQGLETAFLRLTLRPMATLARHAFGTLRAQPEEAWQTPSLRTNLRLLPAAWKAHRAEKQRDRERKKTRPGGGGGPLSNHWWWVLLALGALANGLSHLSK